MSSAGSPILRKLVIRALSADLLATVTPVDGCVGRCGRGCGRVMCGPTESVKNSKVTQVGGPSTHPVSYEPLGAQW